MGIFTVVEVWKQVDGHPDYEVSNLGRVRSNKKATPLIMRTRTDRYGHHKLELDGKTRKVHQLVAYAFIPMHNQHESTCEQKKGYAVCLCPPVPQCIRHLSDDKNDNSVSNLAWGTYSENLTDAYVNGRRPSKKHGTP